MPEQLPTHLKSRFVLRPVAGGYKIEALTWDDDMQGWFHARWLGNGRKFPSREAAREFMLILERDAVG
jgi:hypothetical protein